MQTSGNRIGVNSFLFRGENTALTHSKIKLYEAIKESVPIIDAAIGKTVRLTGGFKVSCNDPCAERELNRFLKTVPVGAGCVGIDQFVSSYLESLLTYGTAVGEIVTDRHGRVYGLYNAYIDDIELKENGSPMKALVYRKGIGEKSPVKRPELIFVSALNPQKGSVYGTSILNGLPFVADILLKIYNTVGVNWERAGNVRYAITYKPTPENERNASRDIKVIAEEWGKAMSKGSGVSDFIAAGDVNISVIGADGAVLDSEVPARQMLEQIIAKMSIPPFLLGLSWSTTERMSTQQVDILTSELEYYRKILNPVIEKICGTYLLRNGYAPQVNIEWDNINLQDDVQLANARYTNAQAALAEQQLKGGENYADDN